MYTIGQFSRICKVTTKALRHYEKMGLLTPAQVDRNNQYRYYTRDQVAVVKNITALKDLGIPLKLVKRLIDEREDPEAVGSLLEEHRRHLLRQVELCNSRLIKLSRWHKTMEAIDMTESRKYDIYVKEVPAVQARARRDQLKPFHEKISPLIESVLKEIAARGEMCAGPPVMLYYDEEFNPGQADVEVAWPVPPGSPLANRTLPAVRAAVCMHVGPYSGLEGAYEAVFAWVNQNGYRAVYPLREVSHTDPRTTPPDQLVTEIIIPVERA